MDKLPNIRPPNKVFNSDKAHPSQCKSTAYSSEIRQLAVENRLSGADQSENIRNLQDINLYPSESTVNRWMERYHEYGHVRSFRKTGNHRSQREIKGRNMVLHALFRAFRPKATAAECIAMLYEMNRGQPGNRFHCPSNITRVEKQLCLTRKRGSTTAFEAMTPRNQQWRWNYFNLPYPYGIADIPALLVIDLDKDGIYPDRTNRKYGKTVVGDRCREYGLYVRDCKLNLLLAISGDPINPDRWFEIWENEGTTIDRFVLFIQRLLIDLGQGVQGNRRVFVMDNLNAHKNARVTTMILAAGHCYIFRAPYCAVDGAIEYVFNSIECMLRIESPEINSVVTLRNKLVEIITSIPEFSLYFRHVRFIL